MTKFDPKIHRRRSIRLQKYDYSLPGAYFVTICTHAKKAIFGEIINAQMNTNHLGKIVKNSFLKLAESNELIEIPEFVVMPNHVHVIIKITEARFIGSKENTGSINRISSLGEIIRRFKARCTHEIKMLDSSFGKIWQRNYHEHIIRDEQSYIQMTEYIRCNPQRWNDDIYYV